METFIFSDRAKKTTYALIGIGLLVLITGIVTGVGGQRIWANVLINGFFYFGIALAAVFMISMQYAAEAAWGTILKRVFEGVSSFVPIGAGVIFLVLLVGSFHGHHLYHWMDASLYDPASEHYDKVIAGKHGYLNLPFFWARAILFLGFYVLIQRTFRKRSLEEDLTGGVNLHKKNITTAAIFLVFFGFLSPVAIWDWIMSIDTHWYSTLFGWYTFAGMWISGITFTTLLILYLKRKGHLQQVNENHLHDMGKWMFAISCLWSYMWFFQFMLIWYANIPEEVTYYQARIADYKFLFFAIFAINFVFPFFLLMDRDAKRNTGLLTFVGVLVFMGHWLDLYLMVTPGTMKAEGILNWFEIGLALGFLGLFVFVVLNTLSKAPLVVKQHPYLEESVHLHQ